MPVTLQVTLPAGGKTQISTRGIDYKQLIIQNNTASDTLRIGDSSIVAGAYGTGKGMLILAGASFNSGPSNIRVGILSNWYLAGTAADVIDICYEPA